MTKSTNHTKSFNSNTIDETRINHIVKVEMDHGERWHAMTQSLLYAMVRIIRQPVKI